MLKSLGYPDNDYGRQEIQQVLAPYKLFVLILHDPTGHTQFHQKFSGLFERLDYLTGPNLLFMGIAKPSIRWVEKNESRDYFGIWEKDKLINSFHEISSPDNSLACLNIANTLNIAYDDLPCLVISSDLRDNNFVWVKTDSSQIEKQLTELGYFAASVKDKIISLDSPEFKTLLNNLPSDAPAEFIAQDESLATALADTLSFTIGVTSHFSKDAAKHSTTVLQKQRKKRIQHRNVDADQKINISLLANLATRKNAENPFRDLYNQRPIIRSKDENYSLSKHTLCEEAREEYGTLTPAHVVNHPFLENQWFEPESKIIVTTTKAVYTLFRSEGLTTNMDYSPLITGLSKIFEIEINLSAVHWIRKYLHIELPQFYKICKPSFKNATIVPDSTLVGFGNVPKPIDFNIGKRGRWQAPGIGQSELAVKTLLKQQSIVETLTETELREILQSWSIIRELRNKASHSEIMMKADFEKLTDQVGILIQKGYFNKLLQLKKRYTRDDNCFTS